MRVRLLPHMTLLLAMACGTPERSAVPAAASSGIVASVDAGTMPGGPGAGRRYGLGTTPVRALLVRMDTDVGPDGDGLPPGRGTVPQGDALYRAQCAMCHGARGEGMPPAFPALVGRDPAAEGFRFAEDPALVHTIGNYWPYATTLFDYIKRAMPLLTPGSLTDDEVYALTAYLLAVNDVIPDTTILDATSLRRVRMPYRDRFVPDDRSAASAAAR